MEAADRANEEVVNADDVSVAEPAQHPDDDTDSSEEEEGAADDSSSEEAEEEESIPTPEEVELELTYPQDFVGRSWQNVVDERYCRLIIDPSCIGIPYEQFFECPFIIEVVYPEGNDSKLLNIGRRAFDGCCNLQRMNPFPDGLVELGFRAFHNCWKLQGRIKIPPSIRYVRERCFESCYSITSVVFESSVPTTTALELEDFIFMYCEKLRSVRLPNNLTVIPIGCFDSCLLLLDVPIPGTVQTIKSLAFENCVALSEVDFPESVIAIDERAYSDCSSLLTVTIRSSTNALQIGWNVFGGCSSLSTIKVYPWQFPTFFAAMTDFPSSIYKFFRQYHHQIVDEEAEVGMVTRQHRNGRRRRRQRPQQKKQRL